MKRKFGLATATFALAMMVTGCQQTVEQHVHTFSEEWKYDETGHWKICGCGEMSYENEHIFDDASKIKAATPDSDGISKLICSTCGYSKEVFISYGHVCKFGELIATDENKHWKQCNECGERMEEAAHDFIYKGNGWQRCRACDRENTIPVSLEILGTYDSTKMTFGVYPQTIKADSVTVDKTVKNTEITGADYYLGSDGAWYAECVENAWHINGAKYSNGSKVALKSANSIKYFKVEPIEWVYLAETKCLHAKKALTAGVMWDPEWNGNSDRDYYDFSYAKSNIRNWLNSIFYNSAFTENQKSKIKTTAVDNSAESAGYIPPYNGLDRPRGFPCEDTNDKVYLLSYKEATGLFASYKTRRRKPTDYALASGSSNGGTESGIEWWLRSPSCDEWYAICVDGDGDVTSGGRNHRSYYHMTHDTRIGVVPALTISE